MLELITKYWSEILSVVGAAAWLPVIFPPIINHFRRIQSTVLDYRLLTNGWAFSATGDNIKTGTILMLSLNLYINKVTLFAKKIETRITLNSGSTLIAELVDFSKTTSNNQDGTESSFDAPVKQEFNISRTIHPNVDNVKYVSFLVESNPNIRINEISNIEIRLYYSNIHCKFLSKKIKITQNDFPSYNLSKMIDRVEHTHQKQN